MTEKELEPPEEQNDSEENKQESAEKTGNTGQDTITDSFMNDLEEEKDVVIQAIDELADRAHEIEQLKTELGQATDQLKRQAAEFQNYRRRTEQEKASAVTLGKSIVIQQLLDVTDDFHRSLEATAQAEEETEEELSPAYQSLKSGVELVYQKLMAELERLGVEPIDSVGKPFDEDEHEAMMQQPAAEGEEEGIVLKEIQRGYRMGEKILRHARVIVSA